MRYALLIVGGWAALSLLLGAAISKYCFNFMLTRPGVFAEVRNVTAVEAVGVFDTDGPDEMAKHLKEQMLGTSEYPDDPYYHLSVRPLQAAHSAGLAPFEAPRLATAEISRFIDLFYAADLEAESMPGYDTSSWFRGVVMQFKSDDNKTYTILACQGGQVSNDHYPFYEVLFDVNGRILRDQMFFYDVAGTEGIEGWPIFVGMSIVSAVIVSVVGVIVLVVSAIRQRWPIGG